MNTSIVMAVAEGVLLSKDPSKLSSNGGQIAITKSWAKSILGRMGFRKRKGTNAGKISVSHFEEVKEYFLADITAEVLMNDIPDELIINWDQTPLHIVPTGNWTMHQAGDKIIPVANLDDKRQITAVLAVSLTGTYLAPQLIYQGKTERCHPQVDAIPEGWDIWHSVNHWSNEVTMKRYITKVIVPYVQKTRQELKLADSHPALVIYDVFKGQTTPAIQSLLSTNHISVVLVPPNCTDKLQPLDIAINKPMKDALKAEFQAWYAAQVQKKLEEGSTPDELSIDTTMTAIKGQSLKWIISAWKSIEQRPVMGINGFRKAGILDAISSIRDDPVVENSGSATCSNAASQSVESLDD